MKNQKGNQTRHRKIKTGIFLMVVMVVAIGFFWEMGGLLYSLAENGSSDNTAGEVTVTKVQNKSDKELLTVHSNFYNYRYDDEIKYGRRNQGAQSVTPYGIFNNELSTYYKQHTNPDAVVGIYQGNFYDYWKGTNGYNYQWCKNNYYKFYWAANIANRGNYNAVCQGIVDTKLDYGQGAYSYENYTAGTLTSGNVSVPYFNEDFLKWNQSNTLDTTIGAVAKDVGFPFRYQYTTEKGSYYVYDSEKDVIRFSGMAETGASLGDAQFDTYYFGNKQLEYYYDTGTNYNVGNKVWFAPTTTDSIKSYFCPFNRAGYYSDSSDWATYKRGAIDYGFGVRLDIPFYITENGMQTEEDGGKPMKFSFSGDDDVWIFLDGELALDLGGDHAAATGYIDFSGTADTAKAVVNAVSYLNGTSDTVTSKSDSFEASNTYTTSQTKTITAKKDADHVLTVFYMERGMLESNLYMDFNFIPHNVEDVIATPTPAPIETEAPAEKAETKLTVGNTVNYDNVNAEFLERVKDLVEDDGFRYKMQNKGTSEGDVGDNGLAFPSGVLSVRKNRNKYSYWSFGEKPYVRIYFDMDQARKVTGGNYWTNIVYMQVENPEKNYRKEYYPMIKADYVTERNVYYYDVPLGWKFCMQYKMGDGDNPDLNKFPYWPSFASITAQEEYNGAVWMTNSVFNEGGEGSGDWERGSNNLPLKQYKGADAKKYSNNLPYQTKVTPAPIYHPTSATSYNPVAGTAYELTEHFPAPADGNILVNEEKTTGVTNNSGIVSLLSEDSAMFLDQFKKGSTMWVVLQEDLATINRKSGINSSWNGDDAVTTFETGTRGSYDFYYNTVAAKEILTTSEDAEESSKKVSIKAAGTFNFNNVATEDQNDPEKSVNITETFTHTVKTGSISLYKKLRASTKTNVNYTFTIKFKNIFGVSDGEYKVYMLKYKLYEKDSDGKYISTEKTINSDGEISLKAEQYAVIDGIPAGTEYEIVEKKDVNTIAGSVDISYNATISGGEVASGVDSDVQLNTEDISNDESGKINGKIPTNVVSSRDGIVKEFEKVDVKIVWTNQAGSIQIKKSVTGDYKDYTDVMYKFQVKQNNTLITNVNYSIYQEASGGGYGTSEGEKVGTGTIGDDGIIKLKANRWAVLEDLPLDKNYVYTITEQPLDEVYFEVDEITVKKGNISSKNLSNKQVKLDVLNASNSEVSIEFLNHLYTSYIQIEKYIDRLYYDDEDIFYEGKSYLDLTQAKQSFIFKVEEYDTADCEGTPSQTFDEVITIDKSGSNGVLEDYKYKGAQKIKVTNGKYYKITEDTGWSWKYVLQKVDAWNSDRAGVAVAHNSGNNKYVILQGRPNSESTSATAEVPTAVFYNKRNEDKDPIDGDTDDAVNKIYKDRSDIE